MRTDINNTVVLVDFDPKWPEEFEREKGFLTSVFGGIDVQVEHIGSTAVTGLSAKPVIDILLGVGFLQEVEIRIDAICELGYQYVPEFEDVIPDRLYFRKPAEGKRTHHLHAVEYGGRFWDDHLLFRDYLRTHPEKVLEYDAIKRSLATKFTFDREAYVHAKAPFIAEMLRKAERWKNRVV